MSLIDTSLRRESNCPVHFVWDGNGVGRPFVRGGFLLALVAGALLMLSLMVHAAAVREAAGVVAAFSCFCWVSGQLLTRFALSRARAR